MLYNILFICGLNLNHNFVQIERLVFDLSQSDIGILFFPWGCALSRLIPFPQPAQTMTNIAFGLAKRLYDRQMTA
jgi:hypothetical protein